MVLSQQIHNEYQTVDRAVGIVTVLITEHALWGSRGQHQKASMITFSEDAIDLDAFGSLEPEKRDSTVRDLSSQGAPAHDRRGNYWYRLKNTGALGHYCEEKGGSFDAYSQV